MSWLFSSLRGYRTSWLRGDVVAGLTVWAVLVPEALAYATIAGVPTVVGPGSFWPATPARCATYCAAATWSFRPYARRSRRSRGTTKADKTSFFPGKGAQAGSSELPERAASGRRRGSCSFPRCRRSRAAGRRGLDCVGDR
ncbi:SulP family inorganic anion transporter [Amycolatopsis rhabdoformis]|uniref:SulP family inorganic anion transporter n=1 Tax=Amycolatopsis rhabdoformis TaxID=1448059 RepID=UPI0038993657